MDNWLFVADPKSLDDFWWHNENLSERKRYLFMTAVGGLIRVHAR